MEEFDSLRPGDKLTVTIAGPEGNDLFNSKNTGFHNIETAVSEAISNANLSINPEDCVFTVSNESSGVTHRYRLNAHGHLKLII